MIIKLKNLFIIEYNSKADITTSSFFDNSRLAKTVIIFLTKSFTLGLSHCKLRTNLDIWK